MQSAPRKSNVAYILRCSDGSYYCGWTNDIEQRLKTHNSGKGGKYTRSRLPVELVYLERFETEHEARSREVFLKQLTRTQKQALIDGYRQETGAEHAGSIL